MCFQILKLPFQVSSLCRGVGRRGANGALPSPLAAAHQAEGRPHLPHHAQQQHHEHQQQADKQHVKQDGKQADRETGTRLPCVCHRVEDQFKGVYKLCARNPGL